MTDDLGTTDFTSHHIEGYARAAQEKGELGFFSCPLISEVLPGLWQGGCNDGVRLSDDFDLVVSLYPWEKYVIGSNTQRVEIKAYDSSDVPDFTDAVASVWRMWKSGKKVLVHCQAGLNRSGFFTAQVLMLDGMSATQAIAQLRETRDSMVLCNAAFERALKAMDR